MMHRDRALGVAALALSGAYYWMSASLPQSRLADAVGAGGLPRAYAGMLAALALILIAKPQTPNPKAQSLESKAQSPESKAQSPESKAQSPHSLWRIAGMVAIGVAYVVLAPWLGYLLSIAALILTTTYYQGGALNRSVVVVALGGGIVFWLLFVVFMGIPQPAGWFPPQL